MILAENGQSNPLSSPAENMKRCFGVHRLYEADFTPICCHFLILTLTEEK